MLYNQYLRLPILHKQHVCSLMLHNLEVHKPHMRKTYLNLYLTEPLWRIIEPLRRNMKPRCGMIEPLWRKTELHWCQIRAKDKFVIPEIEVNATEMVAIRSIKGFLFVLILAVTSTIFTPLFLGPTLILLWLKPTKLLAVCHAVRTWVEALRSFSHFLSFLRSSVDLFGSIDC